MKVFVVLSALAAVALAKPGIVAPAGVSPLAYSAGYYNPLGYSYGYAAPALSTYAAAPVAYSAQVAAPIAYSAQVAAPLAYSAPIAAPVAVATKTQYHAQDELGQASYGYAHPGQVHNAVRDAYGNVAGSYSYVDPEGKVVKTDYIADAAGFRVASNALPVAPAVPEAPAVALPVGPAPVVDTPEVVEARAAHLAEHAAAKSRTRRGVLAINAYSGLAAPAYAYAAAPALTYAAAPALSYAAAPALSYAAAPALAYSAPVVAAPTHAVRAATLTTVVNNPGHAVSYRVD